MTATELLRMRFQEILKYINDLEKELASRAVEELEITYESNENN